ncbi:MAG: RluA family pseudouridine synthase [Myxococcales bacterium]|nr:RluA family pseudouridine synthase [Myxococcales bacterium]
MSDHESRSFGDEAFLALPGQTLAAALRAALPDRSWSAVKQLCASGKVRVNGTLALDAALRLRGDEHVTLSMNAPRKDRNKPFAEILFEDPHLVVINKPEDVSTVPWDPKESGTALDLIREAWRRQKRAATATPLLVVHRLDKDTSGVLVFAKSKLGERGLHQVFKHHEADREYVAVAHGGVQRRSFTSHMVENRGDGLRGSTRFAEQGRHAVTHVLGSQVAPLVPPFDTGAPDGRSVSRCRVRLETGRTHQIRIHFAESGHPLVGETVYVRDFRRDGHEPLPAARLLLHAETLAFQHPVTHKTLSFAVPPPASYEALWTRLTGAR